MSKNFHVGKSKTVLHVKLFKFVQVFFKEISFVLTRCKCFLY